MLPMKPFLLILAGCLAFAGTVPAGNSYRDWSDYGGSADSAQYSALSQINRNNVNELQPVWTYPTGDGKKYSFNPLVAHDLM